MLVIHLYFRTFTDLYWTEDKYKEIFSESMYKRAAHILSDMGASQNEIPSSYS